MWLVVFLGACALSLLEGRGHGRRSLLAESLYAFPDVRGTGFVCVRAPEPQQQQHRTTTPAATVVASRRWSRVLAPACLPQRPNTTLAMGRTCPFKVHTAAAAAAVLRQYHSFRQCKNVSVVILTIKWALLFRTRWYEGAALCSDFVRP